MLLMSRQTLSATSPRTSAASPDRAKFRGVCCALSLVAALVTLPSTGAAQDLPEGYTTDEPAAPSETSASQSPETQPVQLAGDATVVVDAYEDTDPIALSEFHQPLAPYGTWTEDPTYGTVWVPSAVVVGPDFAPYQTAGRWALTDEGEWLWVSDYSWGYIPFHYGRWVWIPARGWAWIPGRVYAPAWVVWRVSDYGYVGWAPLPPAYYWSNGIAVTLWASPPAAYVFCPTTHVFHHHVHTYVVRDRGTVQRVAAHSRTYRPAQPEVVAPGRSNGRPTGARGSGSAQSVRPGGYRPASPSLAEVGLRDADPARYRTTPDPRAVALARKSTTASARTMSPPARGLNASPPVGRDIHLGAPAVRSPNAGGAASAPDPGGKVSSRAPRLPRPAEPPPRSASAEAPDAPRTNLPNHLPVAGPSPAAAPRGRVPVPAPRALPAPAARPLPAPDKASSPRTVSVPTAPPTASARPRVTVPIVQPRPTVPVRPHVTAPPPAPPKAAPIKRPR